MTIVRRQKVVLVITLIPLLFSAIIISTLYTGHDGMVIVDGDEPLMMNIENTGRHGNKIIGNGSLPLLKTDRKKGWKHKIDKVNGDLVRDDYRVKNGVVSGPVSNDRNVDNAEHLNFRQNVEDESAMNVEERMALRKNRLKKECHELKANNISPPSERTYRTEYVQHLMVSENSRLLYCYLPKVANTNFRRVFLGLQGDVSKAEVPNIDGYDIYFKLDKKFKYLINYEDSKRQDMLTKYWRFLVVRDPLERLLSGYRNKFFHPRLKERIQYSARMSTFYRNHPNLKVKANLQFFKTNEINFEDFLIYWTDVFESQEYQNEHFVPSVHLCRPCDISYDFIGKYETLDTDVKYMFEKMNVDIDFPGRNDNYSAVATNTLVKEYYEPIPSWLLKKVWNILKFDYLLFGYNLPKWFEMKMNNTPD